MTKLKIVAKTDERIAHRCGHWGPEKFELVLFPGTPHEVVYSTNEHTECASCVMKWAGEAIACAQCLKPILPAEPFVVHLGWMGRQPEQVSLPIEVRGHLAVCCVRIGCLLETGLSKEPKYDWRLSSGIEQLLGV